MNEHLENALAAIQALRYAATRGDTDAAAGLVKIGLSAAGHISALTSHPDGYPGRVAIDTVAAQSELWPVTVGAMKEWRTPRIPASLGTSLPVRIEGRRNLDYCTRTGFTVSIMRDMDKRSLPQLSSENVAEWVDAAMAHLESDCQGNFEGFPWPDGIKEDAEGRRDENANMEKALRYIVKEWLKYGFKQL